jgi:tetratricopeptide (TPR) repeat protein
MQHISQTIGVAILLVVIVAPMTPQSACAQNPNEQIMAYEKRLTNFLEQGRYADAERTGQEMQAFALREFGQGSDMHAAALSDLSAVYAGWGRYEEAEKSGLGAMAIWEQRHGADSFVLGDPLNNLATCYYHQHRFADAARLHRRALAVRTSKYGAQSPQAAMSLENLALTYDRMGPPCTKSLSRPTSDLLRSASSFVRTSPE